MFVAQPLDNENDEEHKMKSIRLLTPSELRKVQFSFKGTSVVRKQLAHKSQHERAFCGIKSPRQLNLLVAWRNTVCPLKSM
jgi:hypothetical protein